MLDDFSLAVDQFMADYGTTGQFIQKTGSSYDPATGTVTDSTVTVDVSVILMDLTLQSNGYSVKYGTLVQEGDKEAYVKPVGAMKISPLVDKLKVGSTLYSIVTFKETNPTGSNPVAFFLYLRR